LVALAVGETASQSVGSLLERDPEIALWWGTPVECHGAIARLERDSVLDARQCRVTLTTLEALCAGAVDVQPTRELRDLAKRLVRRHPLRAADALQLAAALAWCDGSPGGVGFVCLDERLRDASWREGFDVLPLEEVHEP
jgi:predicted nucleic acid-binding protein